MKSEKMPTVQFLRRNCRVEFQQYTNGRTALSLRDARSGEDVTVATVNVPGVQLGPKEVLIKDYSENEGVLVALERAGIVRATGRTIESGWVNIPVAELLVSPPEPQKKHGQATADRDGRAKQSPMAKGRDMDMDR